MCTKLEEQAIELIARAQNDDFERCKILARQLEAKLKLLNEIIEQLSRMKRTFRIRQIQILMMWELLELAMIRTMLQASKVTAVEI